MARHFNVTVILQSCISVANLGVFSNTKEPEYDCAFFAIQLTAIDILEESEQELIGQKKIRILDKVGERMKITEFHQNNAWQDKR